MCTKIDFLSNLHKKIIVEEGQYEKIKYKYLYIRSNKIVFEIKIFSRLIWFEKNDHVYVYLTCLCWACMCVCMCVWCVSIHRSRNFCPNNTNQIAKVRFNSKIGYVGPIGRKNQLYVKFEWLFYHKSNFWSCDIVRSRLKPSSLEVTL